MPTVNVSPNMSLPVPDLSDPGPDYANNVNASLDIIDGHTHTGAPSDGKQLDLSKQTTTGDVQLSDNNLGTTRSVEFVSQPGALVGSQDVNCLYVNSNTLGFNNSAGTFIPLTGPVSALVNNFNAITVTTSHVILATDTINLVDCNSPGGSITITLPRASTISPTAAGRFYIIHDIGGAAASHPITIQVQGGSGDTFASSGNTSIEINASYGYVGVYTDGVSLWMMWTQSVYNAGDALQINNGSISLVNGSVSSDSTTSWTLTASQFTQNGGSFTLGSGTTVTFNAAATLGLNATIAASTSDAVKFSVVNPTIATTGTTTLTTSQYNSPVINCGIITLGGDITIALPSKVGAMWYLITRDITLAGHVVNVTVGSSGGQGISGTAANIVLIVCYAANAFVYAPLA